MITVSAFKMVLQETHLFVFRFTMLVDLLQTTQLLEVFDQIEVVIHSQAVAGVKGVRCMVPDGHLTQDFPLIKKLMQFPTPH